MATDTRGPRPRSQARTEAQPERAREPMPARAIPVKVCFEARIKGSAGTVEFTCLPEQIDDQVRQLARAGVTRRISFDRTAEGHPLCPKHGVVMVKREKQGDEWYSHKVVDSAGQEHYCRGYRGSESPGYEVK